MIVDIRKESTGGIPGRVKVMVEEFPTYLAGGELARLFPVASDGNRERRNNSVLLATLMAVDGFGGALLNAMGKK